MPTTIPTSIRLMALDCSTETVHMALWMDGQSRPLALAGGAQASVTVLPGLQSLLADAGLSWPDVDAFAFGRGPGAFTGIRTACSVVQGLALALDKPVMALDTLLAVAESARLADTPLAHALAQGRVPRLWVLQDARMNEVYAAAYAPDADRGWTTVVEPALWPVAVMQDRVARGEITHAAGSALKAWPDPFAALPPGHLDAGAQATGNALASLAARAWAEGAMLDAALALPLYVRDKVAQTTQERALQKAAAAASVADGVAP